MENRTLDIYDELSKCTYSLQLLKKVMECTSLYDLTQSERDNLFGILAENGLKQLCNGIYIGLEVQMASLAGKLKRKRK